MYYAGSVDGFNEKGVGIHLLELDDEYEKRDENKEGIHSLLWGQYILDNAASVEEAIKLLEEVQIFKTNFWVQEASMHLAIEDASGDSAIIEYVKGKKTVYHNRDYKILTNSPSYDQQLKMLSECDFSDPNEFLPIPGNTNSVDRFQRAYYYSLFLRESHSNEGSLFAMRSVLANVSVPIGFNSKDFIYPTEYRTMMDLTNLTYVFEPTRGFNSFLVNLNEFNFEETSSIMYFSTFANIEASGNVREKFKKLHILPF